jgi:EAL domain-containing protein (putative c-di-GMP-specific phosphodiesterase class I)
MDVVAEGIETEEQLHMLKGMGCRFGQGYLFARPLPAETITELLARTGGYQESWFKGTFDESFHEGSR